MPRIVDHDERRRQIAEALLTVAARDGHERVSSRAVATELGVATGALWHYFDGFDDVVRAAAAEVTRRTDERIAAATNGLRGLPRLHALMREVLPVDDLTRSEARVVVGFWGRVATLAETPDAGAPTLATWQDSIRSALEEAVADGELHRDTPQDAVMALLRSVTYGQQVVEVTEPQPSSAHLAVLDSILAPWRA
ncbi:HTH-type transcriptional regulator BetI [Microbacterium oxydans]|uniref:HTH-type transcriptional regulator BetI n=1 Tax=Microbacterium oxydans TaxID=82380 RepID=A0A0F0LMU0_9MICO|nr:TetR/AcrR family transcriptional regulator [Microbacterium oxydans]KJL32846.1 HTH-type transcriptional regulator BetI [Microbacterium oxydans]CAH0252346.1 HTH-type transcriptional regulator BetI [Microbacterium oxydans]